MLLSEPEKNLINTCNFYSSIINLDSGCVLLNHSYAVNDILTKIWRQIMFAEKLNKRQFLKFCKGAQMYSTNAHSYRDRLCGVWLTYLDTAQDGFHTQHKTKEISSSFACQSWTLIWW